jgi:hypothetical protein
MIQEKQTKKFESGQVVITPNAQNTIPHEDVVTALDRHIAGDWGDCCPEDWEANQVALQEGDRLFSVYHDRNGVKFWVITEWNRSSTCVLLPENY